MLNCECGFIYHPTEAERSLTSKTCPQCKRRMVKQETWLHPIGNMNMLETVRNDGREVEYLKQRKMKHGY